MNKLFARWLPDPEGQIKEGGMYWNRQHKEPSPVGDAIHVKVLKHGNFLPATLFVCSRDIKEGEEIYLAESNEYHRYTATRPDGRIICQSRNGAWNEEFHKQDRFKVIGELSKEASWVTDETEINPDDIQIETLPIWKEVEQPDGGKVYSQTGFRSMVFIRCPLSPTHFH